ncbi:MAG TPA: nuclear transport factor 2 family protein [Gemmatimonadales bacterium]|nr:nuclear transport factor 2 family protein [Gemmatimonadales bacterium]
MELQEHLLRTERELWTNNAVLYQDTLVPEALLVFPETGVITRDAAVEAIRQENMEGRRWAEVHMQQVRTLALSDDAVLLTYRVAARWEHEQAPIEALASSAYVRRDGRWKLAFHQQTPLNAAS